jgi:predicted Fe-Mo cluster-binding NifX family protein
MKVCIPITGAGRVDHRFGRAQRLAVATVENGDVTDWSEFDVAWDVLREQGSDGSHHARVAGFVRDHQIEVVLVDHVGPGMQRMLTTMGVRIQAPVGEDARAATAAAGRT